MSNGLVKCTSCGQSYKWESGRIYYCEAVNGCDNSICIPCFESMWVYKLELSQSDNGIGSLRAILCKQCKLKECAEKW